MQKAIAILTILLISASSLFAANPQKMNKVIPIVDLPAKPTKQMMSSISKNRSLYFSTILEYYEASVAYEAQLALLGKSPNKKVVAPTFQQSSKPNSKVVQFQ